MTKAQAAAQEKAREELRKLVPPGSKITTVLRHVSRSGMSRSIDCYLFTCEDGQVVKHWLSRLVARALGWPFDEQRESVRVAGCGMDMGFHLVNSLSYALHGTTDTGNAANERFRNAWILDPCPGSYVAGYSLKHEWLG